MRRLFILWGDSMGDKEILEIQNLSDDDLLAVYQMILDHIEYLKNNIIDNTIVEGGDATDE